MSAFVNSIAKAASAFRSRDYFNSLQELESAFLLLDDEILFHLDEKLFNALFDALEMTALMAELPVFEKNAFAEHTLTSLRKSLEAFTGPDGGSAAALYRTLEHFILLIGGMNVGMKYLRHKKMRPDDFPPEISFEISEDGYIRLYAWSDESQSKTAKITELKAGFEQLFEKEKKSVAYYLEKAAELTAAKAYEDCIPLLDLAMQEHESIKAEAFVRKGNVLLELNRFEEALDCFMKARVLGEPKQRLSEGIKAACKHLLRYAGDKAERQQWSRLLEDFS